VSSSSEEGVRLQKVLAAAGIGSRRACEQLIDEGRVSVNGKQVRTQGLRVDPAKDAIHVDGERIPTAQNVMVLALNKPVGVLSTMEDDLGRPCVGDYVEQRNERLFHVGRLDADTEGLLLMTNDGDLAHRLMHPSHGVPKTYVATIAGPLPKSLGRQLKDGVELEDGVVAVDDFKVVSSVPGRVMVEVVIHEGRNHVVRRMFEVAGHPVLELVRTKIGPIALGQLRPGATRVLGNAELGSLYTAVGM